MSTDFRLELCEPSAIEDEGQHFFFSDAVLSVARFEPYSLLLSSLALPTRVKKINDSLADGSISSD